MTRPRMTEKGMDLTAISASALKLLWRRCSFSFSDRWNMFVFMLIKECSISYSFSPGVKDVMFDIGGACIFRVCQASSYGPTVGLRTSFSTQVVVGALGSSAVRPCTLRRRVTGQVIISVSLRGPQEVDSTTLHTLFSSVSTPRFYDPSSPQCGGTPEREYLFPPLYVSRSYRTSDHGYRVS